MTPLLRLDNGKFPVDGDIALSQNIWSLFGRTFNNEGFVLSMALTSSDGVIKPLAPIRSRKHILSPLLIRRSLLSSIGGKSGILSYGPKSLPFFGFCPIDAFLCGTIFSNVASLDLHGALSAIGTLNPLIIF